MTPPAGKPAEIIEALQVLELPAEATLTQIRQSYRFLKDLYGGESIATLPVSGEISTKDRQQIIEKIDAAYEALIRFFEDERGRDLSVQRSAPDEIARYLADVEEITGAVLKTVRKMQGFVPEEVAAETRIPVLNLERIEQEDFAAFPPPVYTRGFVSGYADFLGLEADRASSDFMRRFNAWKENRGGGNPPHRFRLAFWKKKK
ncbi:MAG: helix-turn-helix domain-containing protein [Desulfobacterales bacterium]|nr:helix-turn-helix domain-containing protein [Desulfobacterales bacterium]